jgi:hypothetical protein
LQAALDPLFVGRAYVQVLQQAKPPANVAVGSWDAVRRVQGQNDIWLAFTDLENKEAAFVFEGFKAA